MARIETKTNASSTRTDAPGKRARRAAAVPTPPDRPPSTRPQPQPWSKPEDREGWEVVARGRDRRDRPPVGTALFVELRQEQAAWVREAAAAAGVSQVEIVRRLIDQARAPAAPGTTRGAG